jgi:hypothetical protein
MRSLNTHLYSGARLLHSVPGDLKLKPGDILMITFSDMNRASAEVTGSGEDIARISVDGYRTPPSWWTAASALCTRSCRAYFIELYEIDKRHPSLAGTYLAAGTVYATLYRKSPVGLGYMAGLSPALVFLLQASAWETVQDYFKP